MNTGRYADLVVRGMALDADNQLPIILLNDPMRDTTLPIQLGPFEASAIIMELEGIHPPRPLTHDLFASFLDKHRFTMTRLTISGTDHGNTSASIEYRKGLRRYFLEVRPSDGLALAIRLGAQIRCDIKSLASRLTHQHSMEGLLPFPADEPAVQH